MGRWGGRGAGGPGIPGSPVAGGPERLAVGELAIVNPPEGATYLIDPTLRREFQALPLRVIADRPGRIEWSVDGQTVGQSSADSAFLWPLTRGSHRLAARDEHGRRAETTVVVR